MAEPMDLLNASAIRALPYYAKLRRKARAALKVGASLLLSRGAGGISIYAIGVGPDRLLGIVETERQLNALRIGRLKSA